MKNRDDWATRAAKRMLSRPWGSVSIARAIRAAYRRGVKKEREAIVEMLIVRSRHYDNPGTILDCANEVSERGKR